MESRRLAFTCFAVRGARKRGRQISGADIHVIIMLIFWKLVSHNPGTRWPEHRERRVTGSAALWRTTPAWTTSALPTSSSDGSSRHCGSGQRARHQRCDQRARHAAWTSQHPAMMPEGLHREIARCRCIGSPFQRGVSMHRQVSEMLQRAYRPYPSLPELLGAFVKELSHPARRVKPFVMLQK